MVQLLGATKIKMWVFLVPTFEDRLLITHASRKAAEVRGWGLTCTNAAFEIQIATDADFPVEVRTLANQGVIQVQITPVGVPASATREFTAQSPDLDRTLWAKLVKIPTLGNEANRSEYHVDLLRSYLLSENIMSELDRSYPELFEEVSRNKKSREEFLRLESLTAGLAPNQLIKTTFEGMQDTIRSRWPSLRDEATVLAWGSIADWLMRCPLDFPVAGPGNLNAA